MKKDEKTKTGSRKKLLLRKDSIRALDNKDLSLAVGGESAPPDGGCSTVNG